MQWKSASAEVHIHEMLKHRVGQTWSPPGTPGAAESPAPLEAIPGA